MIFLESPWPILFLGIVAEAILAVALVRTGRGVLLWAVAGVALVVFVGVVVERLVVTERKLVMRTIDGAAEALEANDLDRLLQFIAPGATDTRNEACRALSIAQIVQVRINGLEITIVRTTSPPTAKATFTAIATARDRRGEFGEQTRPIRLMLHLQRQSGGWLITDHKFLNGTADF